MPLVFFLSPSDPRNLKTLEATLRSPRDGGLVANSLVYRYNVEETTDGLKGEEGTFNICTFWLVEALTRAGRTDRRQLERGWPLGLVQSPPALPALAAPAVAGGHRREAARGPA